MKNKLFLSLILSCLLGIAIPAEKTYAFSFADFQIQKSSFLPDNPFYFIKEVGRNLQRAITRDPIAKAELEINILDEKALEISSADNPDEKSLKSALVGYIESASRLKDRFNELKEISSNPNIDRLLEKSIIRSIKHIEIFEGLKESYPSLKETLSSASSSIMNATEVIPGAFGESSVFESRINEAINSIEESDDKEIDLLNALNVFSDNIDSADAKMSIAEIKEELYLRFEGRCEADKQVLNNIADLFRGVSDNGFKIGITDGLISTVEYSPLKLKLLSLREEMISYFGKENNSENAASAMIAEADKYAKELSKKIDSSSSFSDASVAKSYLALAGSDMASASVLFGDKKYSESSGLILSALGKISVGFDSFKPAFSVSAAKDRLSAEYDRLSSLASSDKITRDSHPSIWSKMDLLKSGITPVNSKSSENEMARLAFEIEMLILKSGSSAEESAPPEVSLPEAINDIACSAIYDPVCGENGKTYSNPCMAESASGVKIKSKGVCPAEKENSVSPNPTGSGSRFCVLLYDPVCGNNGVTYSNSCFADIAGVSVIKKGSCDSAAENPPLKSPSITP